MTDRPASSPAGVLASGYPVPQITNVRMVLADLRREDGCALLLKMLGRGELDRLLARDEPYVVAQASADGGYRATMSVIDEAHLRGYVNRAIEINLTAQVFCGLEPRLASDLIRCAGLASGGGRA